MADLKETAITALAKARDDLDEALESIERLPSFDSDKVGFTAHALGNYLTVIDGTLQLLQRALKHQCEPDVLRWLQGLQHTTDLMGHMLSQLLKSTSLQANVFKIGAVDLSLLVSRCCSYYQRSSSRKSISIQLRTPDQVPAITADVVAVAATLDNLISNAVKYSPIGSTIQVDIRPKSAWVECMVRDEGPGLAKRTRRSSFNAA
jgi:signal transduction histidine kinase